MPNLDNWTSIHDNILNIIKPCVLRFLMQTARNIVTTYHKLLHRCFS